MTPRSNVFYIYKFQNLINNKIYIGSTNNPRKRYREHIYASINDSSCIIHRAIRKYGKDKFSFEIISTIFKEFNVDNIEQWFIDHFNSMNNKNGYNMIGVTSGTRPLISNMMKNEWSNPETREKRLKSMKEGSIKKSIISVSIYDGSYKVYESVNDAGRDGYSYSCIYPCLQNKTKTGQGQIWFYFDSNPEQYILKAKNLLGEFKVDFNKSIIAINKLSGEEIHFKDTFALKEKGFKPKAVRRVLRGEREGYAGFYWKYRD